MPQGWRKETRKTIQKILAYVLVLCAAFLPGLMPAAFAVTDSGLDINEIFEARDMQQGDMNRAAAITLTDGQDVMIDSAGTWVLRGAASDVMIYVDADENAEVNLILDGVNISNRDTPCIYVEQAGKVVVTLSSDSVLSVGESFRKDSKVKASAVVFSRSDLSLNGDAALTIDSPKNGIVCRDRLRISGGAYTINAASKTIAADNAIWIMDGSFRLTAGTDGLHAENEDNDREGSVYIGGGVIEINAGDDGIHGQTLLQIDDGSLTIHADEGLEGTWILINGGELDIHAVGDGINAAHKSDAWRPKAEINSGHISITMRGEDTDAIDSNADLIITGGVIELFGSGIDYDGELFFSGGKVSIDGAELSSIPNQSTHHLAS